MLSPGPQHEIFMQWTELQGISVHGVRPARTPGRGVGIVAQRAIRAGETLVHVPQSALLTTDLISQSFKDELPGITVHGLLASFLASFKLGFVEWRATWPSIEDFRNRMPLLGPYPAVSARGVSLKVLGRCPPLPPEVCGLWTNPDLSNEERENAVRTCLRAKQEAKLQKDWHVVCRTQQHVTFDEYVYFWLIVNTRCFYYDLGSRSNPTRGDDRMCLCPYIDYFNHSDEGCLVQFEEKGGFTVISDRDYNLGEEIFTCYGSHSNDTLLAEYGFILEKNKWDYLRLDPLLLSVLPRNFIDRLSEVGYLGNYVLDHSGVCYRTSVAVRLYTLCERDWKQYIKGLEDQLWEQNDEGIADAFICQNLLLAYYGEALRAQEHIEGAKLDAFRMAHLTRAAKLRWLQIKVGITKAFRNGINQSTRSEFESLFESEVGQGL